jgi:hypothetical protein
MKFHDEARCGDVTCTLKKVDDTTTPGTPVCDTSGTGDFPYGSTTAGAMMFIPSSTAKTYDSTYTNWPQV